jgi:hypothetical protein
MPTASIAVSTPFAVCECLDRLCRLAVRAVDCLGCSERARHCQPIVVEVDHDDLGWRIELCRKQRGQTYRPCADNRYR